LIKSILVLSFAFLLGCQGAFLVKKENLPRHVDKLLSQNHYRQALLIIENTSLTSTQYDALKGKKNKLLIEMKHYDTKIVQTAHQLVQQNNWREAQTVFDSALSNLQEGSKTQQAYEQFLEDRDRYIAEQSLKLNLLLGERMVEEGEHLNNIYQAGTGSWTAGWNLDSYLHRREKVAEFLSDEGLAALKAGQYDNAKKYLTLANRLQANKQVSQALAQVNTELDTRWIKYLTSKTSEKDQQYADLLQVFVQAATSGELVKARHILTEMQKLNPDDSNNVSRLQQLRANADNQVSTAIVLGQKYYTEGNIQLALNTWQKASGTDAVFDDIFYPELQQHIARAERFLANYRSLSSTPP